MIAMGIVLWQCNKSDPQDCIKQSHMSQEL
jgi:hypothetical protein